MYAFFINLINAIIKGLGVVLTFLFSVFPDSPFQAYIFSNSEIMKYLKVINYFIPISQMLVTFEAVLTAVGIYYIYQIVARWVKVIE